MRSPRTDDEVVTLAAAHWGRWEAAIKRRDDVALGALGRLLEAMAEINPGELPTDRELEVLQLYTLGHTNRTASDYLGVSLETIKSHLANVRGKLGARSTTNAVAIAIRRGLI